MSNQDLFDAAETTTAIAAPSAPLERLTNEATDLRHMMMSAPVQAQAQMLAEFKERRDYFRDWLLRQLREGLHYGTPPGCEPKRDAAGNLKVPPEQWLHKPTLYAAGADFICELMGVRDTYDPDMLSWEQLGKPVMTYVRKCSLWSRKTGELLGEGTGARKTSENEGSVNDALKMADKSAKIAAVMNTYGLRDLFVQPEDKPPPPKNANPAPKAGAPDVGTRDERGKATDVFTQYTALVKRWKENTPAEFATPTEWASYCRRATKESFDVKKTANWTPERLKLLREFIESGVA